MVINGEEAFFNECKDCLDFFGVMYNVDVIMLTHKGKLIIEHDYSDRISGRMIGRTINEISIYVAEKMNKKTLLV